MTATLTMPETDPRDRLRVFPPVRETEERPTPALDLPPSRIPHDAERWEREQDFLLRLLYALGGSATYDELHDRVPASMNRPENDEAGNLTPLVWALRRAIQDNLVTCEPDGWHSTYHLRDTGAARFGLPGRENAELRDLLVLADEFRGGIAALINGEASGWTREQYAGISYKLAEIVAAAGMAGTRAGATEHRQGFLAAIGNAFRDLTRGR